MRKMVIVFLSCIFLFISCSYADVLSSDWENASLEELEEASNLIQAKIDTIKNVTGHGDGKLTEEDTIVQKEFQEKDFIKDLSKGLSKRWDMSNQDTTTYSESKLKEYHTKLIECELEEIAGYSGVEFSDEILGEYAASYLYALQEQWIAVNDYLGVDDKLYEDYWYNGRQKRYQLLYWINKKYGLDIPEKNYDTFKDMIDRGLAFDAHFSVEESLSRQLRAIDLSFIKDKYGSLILDAFTLTNDTSYNILYMTIMLEYLDEKGNVLNTNYLLNSEKVSSKAPINIQQNYVMVDSFAKTRFKVVWGIDTGVFYDQYEISILPVIQYSYVNSTLRRDGELAAGQPNLELQIIEYKWDYVYSNLYTPQIKIAIKNTGTGSANSVIVSCVFKDMTTQEIWDEDSVYLVGVTDTSLDPGYSKNAIIKSNVGYTKAPDVLPELVADIYVNGALAQSIDSITQ